MDKKKKHTKSFKEFDETDAASTDNWPAPEYLVQPAKGDKGFALAKSHFRNLTKHFSPGMSGAGLTLPEDK
jgi:hypothetical protein